MDLDLGFIRCGATHRHETHRKLRHMAGSFRLRLVLHPPASNYFTLGRIDEDQAQDYAKRKGWDEREMMKWLGVAMK